MTDPEHEDHNRDVERPDPGDEANATPATSGHSNADTQTQRIIEDESPS